MKFTWEEIVAVVNAVLKSCTYDEFSYLLSVGAVRQKIKAMRSNYNFNLRQLDRAEALLDEWEASDG